MTEPTPHLSRDLLPEAQNALMLGKLNIELADSIRPELWTRVEQLLAERAARKGAKRRDAR